MTQTKANKEKIEEIKQKMLNRANQEKQAEDIESMSNISYDIVQIPGMGNTFDLVKLKYDLDSKKGIIVGRVRLDQKVIGLSYKNHKEGLSTTFDRLNRVQNKGEKSV